MLYHIFISHSTALSYEHLLKDRESAVNRLNRCFSRYKTITCIVSRNICNGREFLTFTMACDVRSIIDHQNISYY